MREIRIRLLWHKQAQFAGYLLAEELGLGNDAGVQIVCEGLDFSCKHVNAVLEGRTEMCVASPAHLVESSDPAALRWLPTTNQPIRCYCKYVRTRTGLIGCTTIGGSCSSAVATTPFPDAWHFPTAPRQASASPCASSPIPASHSSMWPVACASPMR